MNALTQPLKCSPTGPESGSAPPPATKTSAGALAGAQKSHSYKPLPTHFLHDGFNYRQVAREGDAAIYEQTWAECADPRVRWEVIRIRKREGFEIGEAPD